MLEFPCHLTSSGYHLCFCLPKRGEIVDKIPKFGDVWVRYKTQSVYLFGNNIISLAHRQQKKIPTNQIKSLTNTTKMINTSTSVKRMAMNFAHTCFQLRCLNHSWPEISRLLESRKRILISRNFFSKDDFKFILLLVILEITWEQTLSVLPESGICRHLDIWKCSDNEKEKKN